jgi:molybdopterin-biosynthesis enzyme MoeA-like protein
MSGSIRDENGHFLLAELRKLGLHTEELVMIRDKKEVIADTMLTYADVC